MNKLLTVMTAAGAALALGAFGTPASSMTIITPVPGSPVSGLNPYVGLPVLKLSKGNTYDFTFSMAAPLVGGATTQVQEQAQVGGGIAEPISFSLYSGTPGSGTLIGTSPVSTSSVLSEALVAGDYYIQITSAEIAVNKEVESGSIVTVALPEPASWAMMLVGFGGVGAIARRRKALLQAA